MSETIIKLEGAVIRQQKNTILKNVNVEINSGEFVYLIGKVGSGKSSLLKTLYAELPLEYGKGEVAGFKLNKIKKSQIPLLRRKCGIVFQDFKLLTDRDVYCNLEFVLKATGWNSKKSVRERIENVLAKVGMLDQKYKMPHQLSGGEQQRIVLARALLNAPPIILADEPTGNIDPETSYRLVELLKDICDSGKTVVIATHQYDLIERYPGKVLRCENGEVFEDPNLSTSNTVVAPVDITTLEAITDEEIPADSPEIITESAEITEEPEAVTNETETRIETEQEEPASNDVTTTASESIEETEETTAVFDSIQVEEITLSEDSGIIDVITNHSIAAESNEDFITETSIHAEVTTGFQDQTTEIPNEENQQVEEPETTSETIDSIEIEEIILPEESVNSNEENQQVEEPETTSETIDSIEIEEIILPEESVNSNEENQQAEEPETTSETIDSIEIEEIILPEETAVPDLQENQPEPKAEQEVTEIQNIETDPIVEQAVPDKKDEDKTPPASPAFGFELIE